MTVALCDAGRRGDPRNSPPHDLRPASLHIRSFSRLKQVFACPLHAALLVAAILTVAPNGAGAQIPDASQSFYVPQTGPVATPTEGTAATRFFRVCPNNDGGGSLPNNARIKVVLRNSSGVGISGIAAADICMLFNGGTAAQGFGGVGADSIIANSTWNTAPLCPNVTCIPADAPTDVNGVTYITFTGATPGSPGVGTRDPARKWGHYDSLIPVFALGIQISGRLTSASPANSYVLQIKNLDFVDGLDAVLNAGEAVTGAELTALIWEIGVLSPITYWIDFDGSGGVGTTDFNLLTAHLNHDCKTPLDP